jgi:hypothetical protein
MVSEPVLPKARLLPVSVRVQVTELLGLTVGALQVAVTPLGRPETIAAAEPGAPAATVAPPNGLMVTDSVVVPREVIESFV